MMVENFQFITATGKLLVPNVTPNKGDSLFEFATEDEYKEYINNITQGLRWDCFGKEVRIFEPSVSLFGLPTPDARRVFVIYPYDHHTYSSPGNAVVYNADGSIDRRLMAPKPISTVAKQRERFMDYDAPFNLYFDTVRWATNDNGEVVMAVQIAFDRDWLEEREWNPVTGHFGECRSSGRR